MENESPLGSNVLAANSQLYVYDTSFYGNKALKGGGAAITVNNIVETVII